jgi:hypothetical protein
MTVFAAEFCSCIYESSFGILSLHTTKAAAYWAMKAHKVAEWESWKHVPEYWHHHAWRVKEYEV